MGGNGYPMAGLVIIAAVSGCDDPCVYDFVVSKSSPSQENAASFFKKNCGATTGYVYEVKVGGAAIAPSARSTVLRFDSDRQLNWPERDDAVINMQWIDDDTLNLTLRQRVRIFKDEPATGNVVVRYDFRPGTTRL